MDVYGGLLLDDLLNLPNDEFFSSSSSSSSSVANTAVSEFLHHHPSSPAAANYFDDSPVPTYSTDFTDALFIPTDDAAELEWVSNYMDDTFTDFPESALTAVTSGNFHHKNSSAFHGRARSKRSRPSTSTTGVKPKLNGIGIENVRKRENFITAGENEEVAHRCSHCASEKTPQWRTGPFGPKTLCNACGVRYKSGRLVPEYRPAASPTFVLTQHSNSHRKVMELRRQKEVFQHHSMQLHQ